MFLQEWCFYRPHRLCSSPLCGRLRAVQQDPGGHGGYGPAEELGQGQQRSHGALQVSSWIILPLLSRLVSVILASMSEMFPINVFVCSLLNSCDTSVAAEVKTALESIKSEISSIRNNKGAEILLENLAK